MSQCLNAMCLGKKGLANISRCILCSFSLVIFLCWLDLFFKAIFIIIIINCVYLCMPGYMRVSADDLQNSEECFRSANVFVVSVLGASLSVHFLISD